MYVKDTPLVDKAVSDHEETKPESTVAAIAKALQQGDDMSVERDSLGIQTIRAERDEYGMSKSYTGPPVYSW